MPYLIDGHNLIGAMADISLADPQDEERLLRRLAAYFHRAGTRAHVYFDRRAPGARKTFRHGPLEVHFVASPRTADQAIARHLQRLGREAGNWTVVSTDHAVRAAARKAGARLLTSQAFASRLSQSAATAGMEKPPAPASSEELDRWMRLFKTREEEED